MSHLGSFGESIEEMDIAALRAATRARYLIQSADPRTRSIALHAWYLARSPRSMVGAEQLLRLIYHVIAAEHPDLVPDEADRTAAAASGDRARVHRAMRPLDTAALELLDDDRWTERARQHVQVSRTDSGLMVWAFGDPQTAIRNRPVPYGDDGGWGWPIRDVQHALHQAIHEADATGA